MLTRMRARKLRASAAEHLKCTPSEKNYANSNQGAGTMRSTQCEFASGAADNHDQTDNNIPHGCSFVGDGKR